eukprot:g10814.t2
MPSITARGHQKHQPFPEVEVAGDANEDLLDVDASWETTPFPPQVSLAQLAASTETVTKGIEANVGRQGDDDDDDDSDAEVEPLETPVSVQPPKVSLASANSTWKAGNATGGVAAPPTMVSTSTGPREVATSAEAEVLEAEAQEARSRAWLWRAQARQKRSSQEDIDTANAGVRAAEQSVAQKARVTQELRGKAQEARQAVIKVSDQVAPGLGMSHLISHFGPENCVSTWRDPTSGSCFLRTECAEVSNFETFEVGFFCEGGTSELQEHRYEKGAFNRNELQERPIDKDMHRTLQCTANGASRSKRSLPLEQRWHRTQQLREEPEMLQSCEDRQGVLLELEKLLDDSLKVPPDEKRITELRESLKETDMQQKHVIDAGRTEGVFNDLRKIVAGNQDFALKGLAEMGEAEGRRHFITQASEHVAVLEVCKALERHGCEVTYLPVDAEGLVNPQTLEAAITPRTICVSIMHSNNETGALQPIKEIVQRVRKASNRVYVHCDASQTLGCSLKGQMQLDVDLLTMAGHKLYAPKGVGALYKRSTVPALPPLLHGAGQESGRRASTENVIHIVGLGKACEIARRDLEKNQKHMQEMRDRLYQQLLQGLGSKAWRPDPGKSWSLRLDWSHTGECEARNGPLEARLPNTLSASFFKVEANTLLSEALHRLGGVSQLPSEWASLSQEALGEIWDDKSKLPASVNGAMLVMNEVEWPEADQKKTWEKMFQKVCERWIKRRRSWPRLP